jgi:hypothetical protein
MKNQSPSLKKQQGGDENDSILHDDTVCYCTYGGLRYDEICNGFVGGSLY